jgi:hypothetical protein
MISANQIKEVVSTYLSDGNADKFIRELSLTSYNIHKNGDQKAIELVTKIESLLADLHAGFIAKSTFQESLRSTIEPSIVVYSGQITTGSSNVLTASTLNWAVDWRGSLIQFGDRQPSLV